MRQELPIWPLDVPWAGSFLPHEPALPLASFSESSFQPSRSHRASEKLWAASFPPYELTAKLALISGDFGSSGRLAHSRLMNPPSFQATSNLREG